MKIYIKSSSSAKYLNLNMFDVDEYDFKTMYGELHCIDYILNIDGYKIKVYMGFGNAPYAISFTYPSGYTGSVSGFKTAQEAIDYLNKNEWWNFKEPSAEQVKHAIEDEWNPPRENYGYVSPKVKPKPPASI